jgi:hypothetical protein
LKEETGEKDEKKKNRERYYREKNMTKERRDYRKCEKQGRQGDWHTTFREFWR